MKTMKVRRAGYPTDGDGSVWQTDTGPVGGWPDLPRRYDPPVAAFSLGFVLEQPTPLPPPRDDVAVLHFSAPCSRPATNRLFGIPPRAEPNRPVDRRASV